ncbi:MAG: SMC-Scp complex subunit ScpB [Deltaproteobacteria bacterium]|nr:SMC-Scp complex subunit ScpB [Deltaproteobacteria bacterium]
MDEIKSIMEALILASESPISLDKIAAVIGATDKMTIARQLKEMVDEYQERRGGICLQEVAGGYQFRTRSDLGPWIKKLKGWRSLLTPTSLETLAVIAYRQPVVKSEIDNIRGVDAGGAIKKLLEKKLIRIMGRKDVPGKPMIYGTTKKFLEVYNLQDLSDLPTLQELKELQE